MPPVTKDLRGRRFGSLSVVGVSTGVTGRLRWDCICDCGKHLSVRADALMAGAKSCGCLTRAAVTKAATTHGMTHTPTYHSWRSMHKRCYNAKHDSYKYYGGRGVTVCAEWFHFDRFLKDMGERPAGHTLDRVNPCGNYEPSNCRWADSITQRHNRRNAGQKT